METSYRYLFWIRVLFHKEQHPAKIRPWFEELLRLENITVIRGCWCPEVGNSFLKTKPSLLYFVSKWQRQIKVAPGPHCPRTTISQIHAKALSDWTNCTWSQLGHQPKVGILSTKIIYLAVWGRMATCICMAEWLFCATETVAAPLMGYVPI